MRCYFWIALMYSPHIISILFCLHCSNQKICWLFFFRSLVCSLPISLCVSLLFCLCLALMSWDFLDLRIVSFFYALQHLSTVRINFAVVCMNPIVIEVNERGLASEQSFVWLNWVCGNGEMGASSRNKVTVKKNSIKNKMKWISCGIEDELFSCYAACVYRKINPFILARERERTKHWTMSNVCGYKRACERRRARAHAHHIKLSSKSCVSI